VTIILPLPVPVARLAGRLAHRRCGGDGGGIIAPLVHFSEGVGDADLPQIALTVTVCVRVLLGNRTGGYPTTKQFGQTPTPSRTCPPGPAAGARAAGPGIRHRLDMPSRSALAQSRFRLAAPEAWVTTAPSHYEAEAAARDSSWPGPAGVGGPRLHMMGL
jgi:hypothetical protein